MAWRVTANTIDGRKMYGVYRIIDPSELDHSGNREIHGEYMDSREAAEEIAASLNNEMPEIATNGTTGTLHM